MAGIIAGAIGGLGDGLLSAGKQLGDYAARSTLQEEAAAIQKERDARLSELSEGRDIRAENRKRDFLVAAGSEADAAGNAPAYDAATDTARPRTAAEKAEARAGVYGKRGLIDQQMRSQDSATRSQEIVDARVERIAEHKTDNARADAQLAEQSRHNKATETISEAAAGRLADGAKLDNAIKQISLDNAKRVEELRKEFATANPERQKQITEQVQLLTGKDNDNYLPVPLKDDMGNVTGYKIFDKKRGEWVEGKSGGGTPYPEGAELKGKDGLRYVVKDGVPVLKGGAQAKAPAAPADPLDVAPAGYDQPPVVPEQKSRGMIERERVLRRKDERDKEGYAKKYLGNI